MASWVPEDTLGALAAAAYFSMLATETPIILQGLYASTSALMIIRNRYWKRAKYGTILGANLAYEKQ